MLDSRGYAGGPCSFHLLTPSGIWWVFHHVWDFGETHELILFLPFTENMAFFPVCCRTSVLCIMTEGGSKGGSRAWTCCNRHNTEPRRTAAQTTCRTACVRPLFGSLVDADVARRWGGGVCDEQKVLKECPLKYSTQQGVHVDGCSHADLYRLFCRPSWVFNCWFRPRYCR